MQTSAEKTEGSQYLYKSSSQLKDQGPWDAIVIGSGMGGMACAAALAKYGSKVLIFEQHYVPGGLTHTFSRKGFTWDVGVHCVGEMGPGQLVGDLLRWLSNDEVQMKAMSPIYETFHFPEEGSNPALTVQFPDSARKFKSDLETIFPDDKKAISKYFKLIKKVSREARAFFALKTMPEAVDRIASNTLFRSFNKHWSRTTLEVLDEFIENPRLKTVLTGQWGYYGSKPSQAAFGIHAITAYHFWNGGWYPVGGAGRIADGLLKTVAESGGKSCVRTPIEKILLEDGKAIGVRTVSGEEFFAKKIISAAGANNTVKRLLPDEYLQTPWGKELTSIGQSPSYICLNIGFEGDILSAGATVSNQWFFESWSMENDLWDVNDPNSIAPIIYLSFPSLKDPHHEAGPNQRQTGEAVTFVPWQAFEKWKESRRGKRDPDYMLFKKEIENRIIAQLKRHIPKLMEKVVYHELSTPLSTSFFTRVPQGAIYGLEATPKRFMSRRLRTRTPIKNLYLAGGDVASFGVAGAMIGGILAAATINPRVFTQLVEKPHLKLPKFLKLRAESSD